MNCPVCQIKIESEKNLDLGIASDKYSCHCNNNHGICTFECDVMEQNIIEMFFRFVIKNDVLTLVYSNKTECGWIVYMWNTNGSNKRSITRLGTGNNPMTPDEALHLINRYKRLLIFS